MAGRDEFKPHASEIPIDNSTMDCIDTAETVQEGFEELCTKLKVKNGESALDLACGR